MQESFTGQKTEPFSAPVDTRPTHKAKTAWMRIDRETPPKREADERTCDFGEIYALFDEETAMEQASRCIQCGLPRCVYGCPLSNRIPEWIALTAEGRFLEAAKLSQSTSNFPEICSRICPQERLCEGACILNARSDPVAIGAIEQFINEYAFAHERVSATAPRPNGRRVAVVGSGPAGLACADELAKRGYGITVFEALNRAGGLLVHGIPAFKLSKAVVDRRVDILKRRGVTFRFGARVGRNVSLAELCREFDAVFWGVGAQRPKPARVPGDKLRGVHEALPFLIQKNVDNSLGFEEIDVAGKRVAVFGGGDTAMDCLRTAVRSGAKETVCLYRRDRENMPGSRKEYKNATEEGAVFRFLTNPVEILSDGGERVSGVRCARMELGEPDAGGRRRPVQVPDSEFVVPAEIVLVAYGFDPVPAPPAGDEEIEVNDWGGVVLDENRMTSVPGIFAGGDAFRGPSLVSEAARDGRLAADGIDRYLAGQMQCGSFCRHL